MDGKDEKAEMEVMEVGKMESEGGSVAATADPEPEAMCGVSTKETILRKIEEGIKRDPEAAMALANMLDRMPSTPAHVFGAAQSMSELRIGRLFQLIEFVRNLRGVDIGSLKDLLGGMNLGALAAILPALQEFFGVSEPISTEAGVTARVKAALKLARVWVANTPGTTDDEFLDKVDRILSYEPLLAAVSKIVAGLLAKVVPSTANVSLALAANDDAGVFATMKTSSVAALTTNDIGDVIHGPQSQVVEQAAIDWTLLLQIAKLIFDLWRAKAGA